MKRDSILLLIIAALFVAAVYAPCDGSCNQSEEVRRG